MFTLIAVIVALIFVIIPWLRVHAFWIIAGIVILIAREETAPDRDVLAAEVTTARSFSGIVSVSNESAVLEDGLKMVTATVTNGGNARIYDVWLRCSFRGRPKKWISDPTPPEKAYVSSDYHYGYISPGSSQRISVNLEPDGYLRVADPNSFSCEPRYVIEQSDLFKKG